MATDEVQYSSIRPSNRVIQGLWIGAELSMMEQLSIASFLGNGHEYHLFVYDDVKNIPAGTVVRDGNEILPSSSIFKYRDRPSYAGFSNFFRYKLLLERGGWWADTDTVCLKAFDFEDEYVFSTEMSKGAEVVNCGVIKVPAHSELMRYAWETCKTKRPEQIVWGETGPRLMAQAVANFSLAGFRKPYFYFCPLGFWEWGKLLEPSEQSIVAEDSYAIHLWNEKWREVDQDKNGSYDAGCLYEQLKQKYLGSEASKSSRASKHNNYAEPVAF